MNSNAQLTIDILKKHEAAILEEWMREQLASRSRRADLQSDADLRSDSQRFLQAFRDAMQRNATADFNKSPDWAAMRDFLTELSRARALSGYSPSETAMFVLSLKQPVFSRLGTELERDGRELQAQIWLLTVALDRCALFTAEMYQRSREEVIRRQQEEMLELSTPVVKLWEGVLALPLIGTLDSARTQVVMENMLQRIVETGSEVAIIDITGVPQVDTLVAQHLLKTVTAARLMGAECIISGIRPQIAQTIVHLGVDLGNITTESSLADAFVVALGRTGRTVVRRSAGTAGSMATGLTSSPTHGSPAVMGNGAY